MKISALVVTFNEEKLLQECLQSLRFCDELVVVDLGSTDESVNIARQFADRIIPHKHVPIVEEIWNEVVPELKHEWMLRADPDEIFPQGLAQNLQEFLDTVPESVGIISLPYLYYFMRKPLYTTVWGGYRKMPKLFHRDRVNWYSRVHAGFSVKNSCSVLTLPFDGENFVKHYWIDSYSELLEKHQRYLFWEGQSRFERGLRFSWIKTLWSCLHALLYSLIRKNGWLGGRVGLFLSFFYMSYEYRSWISLRTYEKSLHK